MEESNKYYLLFDLDGTLTDPKEGICTCVQYALHSFGIEEPDIDKLTPFIGPPLRVSFQEFYGFTPEQAEEATAKYRERYADVGLFENEVYPGINVLLRALRDAGYHLAIASSKPEIYVKRILDRYKLSQYFEVVTGSELDGTRDTKSEVIMECLRRLFEGKPLNFNQVYMIGDRKHDVEGAHTVGIECVGVTYGYGDLEEMKECKADFVVQSVNELKEFLLRGTTEEDWRAGLAETRTGEDNTAAQAEAPKGVFGRLFTPPKTGSEPGKDGKPKFTFKHLWVILLCFLMFWILKGAASLLLKTMVSTLYSEMAGTSLGTFMFAGLSEDNIPILTGNMTMIITGLSFIIGFLPVMRHTKQIMKRAKEEMHLTHLTKIKWPVYVAFGVLAVGLAFAINLGLQIVSSNSIANVQAYIAANPDMSAEDLASSQSIIEWWETNLGVSAEAYSGNLWLGLLVFGLITPFVEEMIFRGTIHAFVRRFFPTTITFTMTAALFAMYHSGSFQRLYAFIMGLLLSWAFEYFGTIWAPVVIHMLVNSSVYLVTRLVLPNDRLASWPIVAVFAVWAIAAFVFLFIKQRKKKTA